MVQYTTPLLITLASHMDLSSYPADSASIQLPAHSLRKQHIMAHDLGILALCGRRGRSFWLPAVGPAQLDH